MGTFSQTLDENAQHHRQTEGVDILRHVLDAAEGGQELIDRIAAEGFASFEEEDA